MNPISQQVQAACSDACDLIAQVLRHHQASLTIRETGVVQSVRPGIARVAGLPGVQADELVCFPRAGIGCGGSPLFGIAFNLDPEEVGVILLGDSQYLQAGDEVYRTGRVMDVPVGEALLGRVVTVMGQPLDGRGALDIAERRPVEREAPAILDRAPVTVPLQTGLKVVDALIPIGRGQRELIIGDRQTGKTAIAIDTILNQKNQDVICVYCAIGQRSAAIAKVIATLREQGAMDYTIVVVAAGQDPLGLQYLTPYGATTMAEYFMAQGRDVLIVYDDLTHHARTYRELSLLLRRPPGREAYPGDIFYLHSRLLERATHLSPDQGGGSLTALPIIETQAQNMSAYIPTNLISRRAFFQQLTWGSRFRGWAAKPNSRLTRRLRAICAFPMPNFKKSKSLPALAPNLMSKLSRRSLAVAGFGRCSNNRNRNPWRLQNKLPSCLQSPRGYSMLFPLST